MRGWIGTPLAILLAAVAASAAGGCGPSEEEKFATAADEICAGFDRQSNRLKATFERAVEQGDYDAAASALDAYGRELDAQVEELAALDVPEADRARMRDLLDIERKRAALGPEIGSALQDGDLDLASQLSTDGNELDQQARLAARGLGFTRCG